jgi:hypothetical protein
MMVDILARRMSRRYISAVSERLANLQRLEDSYRIMKQRVEPVTRSVEVILYE